MLLLLVALLTLTLTLTLILLLTVSLTRMLQLPRQPRRSHSHCCPMWSDSNQLRRNETSLMRALNQHATMNLIDQPHASTLGVAADSVASCCGSTLSRAAG